MKFVAIGALVVGVVGLGVTVAQLSGEPVLSGAELRALGYRGYDVPRPIAAFELVDGDGGTFDQGRLSGQWSLVFFGYANCPDICPVTLSVLAEAERLVGEGRFQTVLVSVDPERDTPELLDSYVGTFSPRFVAATGPPHSVQQFAGSLGAAFRKAPSAGSELAYLVDHTGFIAVVDREARLAGYIRSPFEAVNIARVVRALDRV